MRRIVPFLLVPTVLLVALAGCGQPIGPTLDVDVRVVAADGGPRNGLRVQVAGDEERTDVDGRTRFADVPSPYDATVARQDALNLVHAFRDVDASAPELVLADTVYAALLPALAPRTTPRQATVTVQVGNPGANQYWIACLASEEVALYGCTRIEPSTPPPYRIAARWYGAATIDARLHAVLVQTSGGLPDAFPAYYVGDVAGLDAGTTPSPALTFVSAPAAQSVSATLRPPSALQGTSITALVRVSPGLLMPITWDAANDVPNLAVPPSAVVTLAVPAIGDGEIVLLGRAVVFPCPITPFCVSRSFRWLQDVPAGSDVTIDLLAPPPIVRPLPFAQGVDTATPLEIEDTLDGAVTFVATDVHRMLLEWVNLASTTLDATTTLPDPAAFQMPLPSEADYVLFAIVVPDVDAPDAWMDVFGPLAAAELNGGPGTDEEGDVVITPWRAVETP